MLAAIVIYGLRYSFSVFYVAILHEFGWSRAETAIIFSIHMLVYGMTAPVAGVLVDRWGPKKVLSVGLLLLAVGMAACSLGRAVWQFYFLFGVVVAIGAAIAGYTPLSAMLAAWFVRKRGTAFGIYGIGFGLCYLIPTLTQYLISNLGWRASFLVLGAIPAVVVVPVVLLFMRRSPQEMGLVPDGVAAPSLGSEAQVRAEALVVDKKWAATDWSLPKAMKTHRLWLMFAAQFLVWGLGFGMLMGHQVVFLVDVGYGEMFAASLVGLFGVMYAVGNLCGFVSDRLGREMTFTLSTLGALFAVAMLLTMVFVHNPALPYLYAVALGVGGGAMTPNLTAAVADMFQGRNFGSILGFMAFGFGSGSFIGVWLAGYVHDLSGSYLWAFVVAGAAYACGCVLVWMAAPRKVRLVAGKARRVATATPRA